MTTTSFLTFRLDDRNDFITVMLDRVPSVGEIIHMFPGGDYRISEIKNLIGVTPGGLAYEISSTVVYCTRIDEHPTRSPATSPPLDENGKLPLRPSKDPKILGEQLRQSLVLDSPPTDMKSYKGYLAQIVRDCVLAIKTGNLDAPRKSLDLMAPALHQVERIQNVEPEVAAEVWTIQWVLEIAIEAFAISKQPSQGRP